MLNTPRPPGAFATLFPGRRVATVDADAIAAANHLGTTALPIVNTTILGAVAKLLGLALADVEAALREARFAGGNLAAARAAFDEVQRRSCRAAAVRRPSRSPHRRRGVSRRGCGRPSHDPYGRVGLAPAARPPAGGALRRGLSRGQRRARLRAGGGPRGLRRRPGDPAAHDAVPGHLRPRLPGAVHGRLQPLAARRGGERARDRARGRPTGHVAANVRTVAARTRRRRRLGPGRAERRLSPRARRLPGDGLRGGRRDGRPAASRHPAVSTAARRARPRDRLHRASWGRGRGRSCRRSRGSWPVAP